MEFYINKLRALLILALVIVVSNIAAQTTPTTYRLGFAANLPYINDYTDTFSARTGWGLWGNTEFNIGNRLRFTPGLAYNNFGYNQNYFNDSGATQRRKITEHYFDAVAELSYLASSKENSVRINFGMGASVLLNRFTDQPDDLDRNITIRTLNNKKPYTPNFIAHLGVSAPLNKRIDLGLQYTLSLPHKVFPRDISGRLGTFQIKLAFKIPHPKDDNFKVEGEEEEQPQKLSLYNKDSLIVVVRLKENAKRIKSLEDQGLGVYAEEERQETLEKNIAIVEAFKEKFTLLPVYYFYNTDSKRVLENGFEGLLLNEKLERDSSFRLPKKEYIIAEFGRQFDEVSQTSGMYGLVILNDNFENIPAPFPAFTSNAYGILSTRDVIGKFQKRLYKYLKQ